MRLSGICCLRRTCIMPAYRLNVHKHIRRAYVGVQFLYIRKCSMVEIKQEPHLMLTNPSDAFRGQSRSPIIEPFHMLGSFLLCNSNFVFKTLRFSDIRLQKYRDLEIGVRGHSRSSKINSRLGGLSVNDLGVSCRLCVLGTTRSSRPAEERTNERTNNCFIGIWQPRDWLKTNNTHASYIRS